MSSHTALWYHLVWGTKDRHPWLAGAAAARLHAYVGGLVREREGLARSIGGFDDHVHALVRLRQDTALSEVVRDLKAHSSKWLHRNFPELRDFAWQIGFSAFTVSVSQCPAVERYIAGQGEHHRHHSFQEELEDFLRRHAVEYDREHLWR